MPQLDALALTCGRAGSEAQRGRQAGVVEWGVTRDNTHCGEQQKLQPGRQSEVSLQESTLKAARSRTLAAEHVESDVGVVGVARGQGEDVVVGAQVHPGQVLDVAVPPATHLQ